MTFKVISNGTIAGTSLEYDGKPLDNVQIINLWADASTGIVNCTLVVSCVDADFLLNDDRVIVVNFLCPFCGKRERHVHDQDKSI